MSANRNSTRWMFPIRLAAIALLTLAAAVDGASIPEAEAKIYERPTRPMPESEIDRLVSARLAELNIRPALCSDAVFVRRVYLDVLGTLPTAKEARDFLQDPDVRNKRRRLIDSLLERNEFADYWAMKWSDILRIKAEFPSNLWPNAAQAYHHWVRKSIAENKTYDKFARELLTSSGSNFRVGPVNFYRAIQNRTPEGITRAVALTFMGMRAENWPTERQAGMAAFFSQVGYKPTSEWKEEHVFWDPMGFSRMPGNTAPGRDSVAAIGAAATNPARVMQPPRINTPPAHATFPDGTTIALPADRDPREVFADWLITPENPWFCRNIVNRAWNWLVGRGIIHEPDDIRDDNLPSNPALLAYLEKQFVADHYDMKRLYRLILNSQVYQYSSVPRFMSPQAEAQFALYPLRRLDAEVLIDAINKITGTTDRYTSPIPEPFTNIPADQRAIAIADGSITSSFLALFGRSARATGLENERSGRMLPAQWLHLLNSSHIQDKIAKGPGIRTVIASGSRQQILENLYLTILSRRPTPAEIAAAEAYRLPETTTRPAGTGPANDGRSPGNRPVDEWIDIAWSLINSKEFLYRH